MDILKVLKEKSQKRRQILAQQLGAGSTDNLSVILGSQDDRINITATKKQKSEPELTDADDNVKEEYDATKEIPACSV